MSSIFPFIPFHPQFWYQNHVFRLKLPSVFLNYKKEDKGRKEDT